MRVVAFIVLLSLATFSLPIVSSEPRQPLDCSDWVFLELG